MIWMRFFLYKGAHVIQMIGTIVLNAEGDLKGIAISYTIKLIIHDLFIFREKSKSNQE